MAELSKAIATLRTEEDFVQKAKLERERGALEKELATLPPATISLPDIGLIQHFASYISAGVVTTVHVLVLVLLVFFASGSLPSIWVPFLPYAPSPTGYLWSVLCCLATLPAALHGEALLRPAVQSLAKSLAAPAGDVPVLLGEALRRSRTQKD
jgi:hypothetical protein